MLPDNGNSWYPIATDTIYHETTEAENTKTGHFRTNLITFHTQTSSFWMLRMSLMLFVRTYRRDSVYKECKTNGYVQFRLCTSKSPSLYHNCFPFITQTHYITMIWLSTERQTRQWWANVLLPRTAGFILLFAFDSDPQMKVIHFVISCCIQQKDIILWPPLSVIVNTYWLSITNKWMCRKQQQAVHACRRKINVWEAAWAWVDWLCLK